MGGRGAKGRNRARTLHNDPPPEPPELELVELPPEPQPAPPTEQPRAEPADLEARVVQAWQQLAVEQSDWIRMARIRALLGDLDPAELRQTLITMIRRGWVHLAPDSNRKMLTAADHAAAINIGGEAKHLLAIEPPYFEQQQQRQQDGTP
jgi:hypothetical protein